MLGSQINSFDWFSDELAMNMIELTVIKSRQKKKTIRKVS